MNWEMAKEVGIVNYVFRRIAWRVISRAATGRIPYVLPGGQRMLLPLSSPFASDIYCTRGYVDWGSEQLMLDYLDQLPERGCSYDVGANMGYYSTLLASSTSHVFAFEPDPRNLEDLHAQGIKNLTLVQKAVSESCGTAHFDVSSACTVGHLSTSNNTNGVIEVECITLDTFRSTRPAAEKVTFVKMDVEGYEISCLRGASRLASDERPVFLIEFGIEEGRPNSFQALGEFTGALEYDIYAMIRRPQGQLKFCTLLEMTSAELLPAQHHKMLFLVPHEVEYFKNKTSAGQ
jgi:FkbM family methyltransferase